jgi:hypothetical protein
MVAVGLTGCSKVPLCDFCTPASRQLSAIEDTSWLVTHLTFEPAVNGPGERRTAAGFDLDNFDSSPEIRRPSTCDGSPVDFVSPLDPELTGVDNAGQELIGLGEDLLVDRTFQGELDRAAAEGRLRFAFRVGSVAADGSVPLELLVIEPGQTIEVDRLTGRALPNQNLRAHVAASAPASVRGSLAWAEAETTEPLVDGHLALLPFGDLRTSAFGIAALSLTDRITGNLGGSFSVDGLIATGVIDAPPYAEGDFRFIFEMFADVDPLPGDPDTCQRISVGFAFDAVPVAIVE